MNEFLEQFVIESRELVAEGSSGMLRLEQKPHDAQCLDAVFRAFHTLKGGAGIVEFGAMERAVHAAEDMLGEARSGRREITPQLVAACLASLDQVGLWLDTLARTGELPQDCNSEADVLIRRLSGVDHLPAQLDDSAQPDDAGRQWLETLLTRHADCTNAVTAIRYVPEPDCFFQDEDPVARIGTLPSLLAQELVPLNPWPSLSEFDPYTCNLVLTALTAASVAAVGAHMRGYSGECDIVALQEAGSATRPLGDFSGRAREVLQSQIDLLRLENARQFGGRTSSAGRTAVNVLRSSGHDEAAVMCRTATQASLDESSAAPLLRVLEQLLSFRASVAVVGPVADPTSAMQSSSRTLRVDAERVDALVRLTGELTTAKNALSHTVALAHAEGLALAAMLKERFNVFERLIGDLQRSIRALRVLPLRTVLQRFPRVLRELSSTLGKPVTLEIEGDHTEADKAIVDMLFEPLLHTLRNAIDHGIEEPRVRSELGKPLVATIRIRAGRAGDRVVIEIEDDGAGVDVERVRQVAANRRIATEDELRRMSEVEIIDLIFAAGFSTAAQVTALSGRGVGLDAVRAAIERIGGSVSIESRSRIGTCVKFSLPFSVMMTEVMTVEAGGQSFGLPLEALIETLRVPQSRISGVGAAQVLVHRERTVPLIDLATELDGGRARRMEQSDAIVMMASVSGEIIALRVDRLGERMSIILKPLDGLLAGTRGIIGTTLLGDGRVLLVLDLRDLLV